MPNQRQPDENSIPAEAMAEIFNDYEARANFVGFFDLLYKIDRRLEPERYEEGVDMP